MQSSPSSSGQHPPFDPDAEALRARRKAWLAEGNAVLDARQWWWRDDGGAWHASPLVASAPSTTPLTGPTALRAWLAEGLAGDDAWPPEVPAEADEVFVRGFVYSQRKKADLVVTLGRGAEARQLDVLIMSGGGRVTPLASLEEATPQLVTVWGDAMLRTAAVWLELDPEGNAERALELASTAYEAEPGEYRCGLEYAELLMRGGRVFDAMHVWQTVHAAHPYLPAPLIRLADTLIRLGAENEDQQMLAMADAATGQAVYRFPEEAQAHLVRARFLYTISKPREAETLVHAYLERTDKDIPEAHYLLGLIALDDEDYTEALAQFERTLAQSPSDAGAHRNKACAHHARGETEKARHHLEAAEQNAAGDPRLAALRQSWFGNDPP